MDTYDSPPIATALARRAREGAPAAQVASAVAATLRRVEVSLSPIIGVAGVAALYKRSLLLTGRSHPWLAKLPRDGESAFDLEALAAALAEQESRDAAFAAGELLETFYRLLSGLIGSSLTRKLLAFMWQPSEEPARGNRHD